MSNKQQQFIEAIAPKAQEIQQKYGVPASIAIAQAALESGWGASVKGNNLYGIKADSSWNGESINMATQEYINGSFTGINDKFRAYASTESSMENYGQFLATNGRYAGVIGADANQAANELQRAGYATDPKYAAKLKSIINDYDLTRFDDASYRGYANADESFERTRTRLREQRAADPSSWDDFMKSFLQLLVGSVCSFLAPLMKDNKQIADTTAQDQTTIERPNVPASANNAPTRVVERTS